MSYKGKFSPKNIKKYKGNPTNVLYRSLWERRFMKYCDENPMILEWASEEIIIPYISSWDNKRHRYFPDFYIKIQLSDGSTKKRIIDLGGNTVEEVFISHTNNVIVNDPLEIPDHGE